MSFDIIGDIHGQADALHHLLTSLDYRLTGGAWRHAERTAIFVGDYIDAGSKQRETITTVRRMADAGTAYALMGNHEFNAICWATPDPESENDFLRSRFSPEWGAKNREQHKAFLHEFEANSGAHREAVDWFLSLPLWLELDGLRVVHACWDSDAIRAITCAIGPAAKLTPESLVDAGTAGTPLNVAVERILKGQEIDLPPSVFFSDGYGIQRRRVRRKWWAKEANTYRSAALLPSGISNTLPDAPLPIEKFFHADTAWPTFFGHYCLHGSSPVLSKDFACVDTCAGKGFRLSAYRWDGEAVLDPQKVVSVSVKR